MHNQQRPDQEKKLFLFQGELGELEKEPLAPVQAGGGALSMNMAVHAVQ